MDRWIDRQTDRNRTRQSDGWMDGYILDLDRQISRQIVPVLPRQQKTHEWARANPRGVGTPQKV